MCRKRLVSYVLTASMIFGVSGALSMGSVVASVNSAAVVDGMGELTPIPTPTLTPTPSTPLFDTFFFINIEVDYVESESDTIVVEGKNVLALRSITYQGATLDSSDYEVTTDRIIFTKKFADSLPYGKNEVIVYAMYNPSAMNTPVTVTINKIKSEQKFDSREVSVSVDTLETGSISQQYTIQQKSNEEFDLSMLTIRYYYDDVSGKEQVFACDHAGITLESDPYYYDASKMVTGTFKDGYLEIGFNKSYDLKNNKLALSTRMNHSDWSSYGTGIKDGKVEAFYDGKLVKLDV